jgi:hypothetical protein
MALDHDPEAELRDLLRRSCLEILARVFTMRAECPGRPLPDWATDAERGARAMLTRFGYTDEGSRVQ